ncbi:MAG: hypothetical protein ROO76_23010 [Terriglobia bacterium]|nr:hypothetical protein [Terriglobia bacterium]
MSLKYRQLQDGTQIMAPVNPVNLFSAIRTCSRENWRNSGKWLAYTVGCGFLPVIIGLLLVWGLSTKSFDWHDFVVHGEFVIYAATLIAASTRLISKDTETFPFVHREMFALFAILTLMSSIALYAAIKTANLLSLPATVNNEFIVRFSLGLLTFSLFFSFLVFLLDQQRISPNVRGIAKQKEKKLSDDFDSLENPQ